MLEGLRRIRKEAAIISDQLNAAETKVNECNQRLVEKDNEIASWAFKHDLHFDDSGATEIWPPERVDEFTALNLRRNKAWHEFQLSLAEFAQLKEKAQAITNLNFPLNL